MLAIGLKFNCSKRAERRCVGMSHYKFLDNNICNKAIEFLLYKVATFPLNLVRGRGQFWGVMGSSCFTLWFILLLPIIAIVLPILFLAMVVEDVGKDIGTTRKDKEFK
jgi:hypothetical protein